MRFPPFSLKAPWRVTILLAVGECINYGNRAAMSSVMPRLQQDLRLSDVALGLLGSLFMWSYGVSAPIAGMMADRYSRRKMCLWGLAAWSVVMVMTGFVGGLIALCVLRVVLGVSESVYPPSAMALVGDYHRSTTLARGVNMLNCADLIGLVALGTLAGFLTDAYGWRSPFLVFGIGSLGFAVIFGALFRKDPVVSTKQLARPGVAETLRYLIRVPSYYVLMLKMFLSSVANWIFITWLPYYFHESFGMKLGA